MLSHCAYRKLQPHFFLATLMSYRSKLASSSRVKTRSIPYLSSGKLVINISATAHQRTEHTSTYAWVFDSLL